MHGSRAFETKLRPLRLKWPRIGLLILAGVSLAAEQIPHVTAETLAGNKLELPSGLGVKYQCSVLASRMLPNRRSSNGLPRYEIGFTQRVAVYPVAILEDAPRLVRGMILDAMKRDVPPAELNRFLILYKGEKEWKQTTGFEAADDAYLIVLDPTRTISYKLHGEPTAKSVNEVSSHITAMGTVIFEIASSELGRAGMISAPCAALASSSLSLPRTAALAANSASQHNWEGANGSLHVHAGFHPCYCFRSHAAGALGNI